MALADKLQFGFALKLYVFAKGESYSKSSIAQTAAVVPTVWVHYWDLTLGQVFPIRFNWL